MIKTKFLSLKTLNALNEVSIEPVMKPSVGETLLLIPEDSRAYFFDKDMGYHNAFTAAENINRKLGYKAYVVKTNDQKRSYMVYHFSRETLEKGIREYEEMVRI